MKAPRLEGALGKVHDVEKGITVEQFLKDIEPDVYIFIAASSTAYYIGTVKDFEKAYPLIDFHFHRRQALTFLNRQKELQKIRSSNMRRTPGLIERIKFLENAKFKPHKPICQLTVKEYYSRRLPDEPPMWMIITDGKEEGDVVLLSEMKERLAYYEYEMKPDAKKLPKAEQPAQTV